MRADFNDLLHLTSAGAAPYTAWLADELVNAIEDRQSTKARRRRG